MTPVYNVPDLPIIIEPINRDDLLVLPAWITEKLKTMTVQEFEAKYNTDLSIFGQGIPTQEQLDAIVPVIPDVLPQVYLDAMNQVPYIEPIDLTPAQIQDQADEILDRVIAQNQALLDQFPVKDKAYYKGFTLRELAYITNSHEITHSYAHSIIQSGTKNPLDWSGRLWKYEDYQRRDTAFTSDEIDSLEIDYQGYTIDDFHKLVQDGFWSNDKARYAMNELGIYDYAIWNALTGHVGKGSKFMDEVGSNIGNVFAGITKFAGNLISDIGSGLFEGLLGSDWKQKLIIYGSIAGISIVGILLLFTFVKAKVVNKAVDKTAKTVKEVLN
jgi:hypothetical protein